MSISSLRFFGRHDYPRKKLNQKRSMSISDKVSELEYDMKKERICSIRTEYVSKLVKLKF